MKQRSGVHPIMISPPTHHPLQDLDETLTLKSATATFAEMLRNLRHSTWGIPKSQSHIPNFRTRNTVHCLQQMYMLHEIH